MLAVLALALAAAGPAAANGDPASHFLLAQDVFLPFQQRLSDDAKADLVAVVERANERGYPLKVAVINTPSDLGTAGHLFAFPQEYAEFLGKEIGFQFQGHLLIAMPEALGLSHRGGEPDPQAAAIADIPVGEGADGPARAAITAVERLAAVEAPAGGGFPLVPVLAAVTALLLVGGVVALLLVARRRQPAEPEAGSSTTT
ncbi:MAG: hypothetical protein ICV64_12115 [Thermoleophilia bacterium]|nr:hypothetical protein [Thermoleophilia bacterium]